MLTVFDIIRKPVITEKAYRLLEDSAAATCGLKYVLEVAKSASKTEISRAVEAVFRVQVAKVNLLNVKGKRKVFKGKPGQRSNKKKAIITLAQGQKIDKFGMEGSS